MPESSESENGGQLTQLTVSEKPLRDRLRAAMPQRLQARARLLRRRMRPSPDASLAQRLDAIDPEYVAAGARQVEEADVRTVVEKADAIEERFRDNGPLRRLLEDGRLLMGLVRDAWRGRYQAVPWWTLSGAVFTLLYVLNPLDLVPDALPVLGALDDAAVVSACLVLLEQDLHEYRRWLQSTTNRKDGETILED